VRSRSWPFCRVTLPTHRASGASQATSRDLRARSRSPSSTGRYRVRSTPFGTTQNRPRRPCARPRAASPSPTQTKSEVQRAAIRSHARVAGTIRGDAASHDQPCGWKSVGNCPWTAMRPAKPAFDECRWTTSGATSSTERRSRAASSAVTMPGDRVAGQETRRTPRKAKSSARRPAVGHATVTSQPLAC
jgi:hypothetical protein